MVYEDGFEFEQMYQQEVAQFANANTGVSGDNVEAAIILRDAGKLAALKLLHDGVIEVVGAVDLDCDTVSDLTFRVV